MARKLTSLSAQEILTAFPKSLLGKAPDEILRMSSESLLALIPETEKAKIPTSKYPDLPKIFSAIATELRTKIKTRIESVYDGLKKEEETEQFLTNLMNNGGVWTGGGGGTTPNSPGAGGGRLLPVHTIPMNDDNGYSVLDMWAGFDGSGFDGRIFLSTGGFVGGRGDPGHAGAIFSHHDDNGDTNWVREYTGPHYETVAKIRDWTDANGRRVLYCWAEAANGGHCSLLRRSAGSATWTEEDVRKSQNSIGGRGLGVNYWQTKQGPIYFGQTEDATNVTAGTDEGWVYRKSLVSDPWTRIGTYVAPTTMRELEFEENGILWKFFHQGGPSGYIYRTYRADKLVESPKSTDGSYGVRHAAWFPGSKHMYVAMRGEGNHILRFVNGTWQSVLSAPGRADHVLYVPRGNGELWATFMSPLSVWKTTTGNSGDWKKVHQGPDTGINANHLTAIGYYNGRIWVAAREQTARVFRIYKEEDVALGTTNYPTPKFLWKPKGDGGGGVYANKLVILTPPQYSDTTEKISVSGAFGPEEFSGFSELYGVAENAADGRTLWRFTKLGSEYGTNVTVNIYRDDGKVEHYLIPNGALRYDTYGCEKGCVV